MNWHKNLWSQKNVGNWWGGFKQVATQLSLYYQVLVLALILPTAYTTTLAPWLHEHNISIPFWVFAASAVGLLVVVGIAEYKLSLPSYFSFWNQQYYRHDNPLVKDVKALHDKIDTLTEKIEALKLEPKEEHEILSGARATSSSRNRHPA